MPSFRALGAAAVLAGAGLVSTGGCDNATGKADKQIQRNITVASAQINGSDQDRAQAESLLSSLSQLTEASSAEHINVLELRAQFELQDAQKLQPKIDRAQAEILRLVWEMQELGGQIQASNEIAADLGKFDPATIQAALAQSINQVKGSGDQSQWIKTETGGVPSLASVSANIASLQAQIDQLQGQIKTFSDQRATASAQADRFNQDSEKAKGTQSLDLYKQSAEAQKRAEELSVQIDDNTVKLSRAQTDLDIARGQEKALNGAIKDLTAQSDQSAGVWKTLQQQIENQKTLALSLLGDASQASASANPDDPTGGSTLNSKAAALTEKLKTQQALRQETETHLNNAAEFFKDAGQIALTLQGKLQTQIQTLEQKSPSGPEIEAWRDESVTMHPARYKLQQAIALDRRAAEALARASEAAAVLQLAATLKPILGELQQPLPAVLDDSDNKLADDVKTGRQLADASYQTADEQLKNIIEGSAAEDQKRAARLASIFTQYGWYLLGSSVGDQTAAAHLDEAKAQRDEVLQNGSEIKGLPAELVVVPAAPAATPH
jgi:hypothetical protein